MSVNCKLEIIRKTDGAKYTFVRNFLGAEIDRRMDMGTTQCTLRINNTKQIKLTDFGGINGIVDNSNRVNVFWNNVLQFTGIIKSYKILSTEEVLELNCHDDYYKLLRAVDQHIPYLVYNNIMCSDMVEDLCKKAGLKVIIKREELKDYKIEKETKIKYDTQYSDVIEEAITTMEGKGIMRRDGVYVIDKQYPNYKVSDVPNNCNYNWYYEDFHKIADAESARSIDTLYSRLLVRYKDTIFNVFEDERMKTYLQGERFTEKQSILGDTEEKRYRIANREFLDMWRRNTKLDLILTKANPKLQLRDVVRTKIKKDYLGHYMVVGIKTSFTPTGVWDSIALEGMRQDVNLAKLSTGDYTIDKKKKKNETYVPVKGNEWVEFDIEDKGKKIKIGFVDLDKPGQLLEVYADFKGAQDSKHYDLIIEDPNHAGYGFKQKILGEQKTPATLNKLNSCEKLQYSGWAATMEYFIVTKAQIGRWYFYIFSDTDDGEKIKVRVNRNWSKVMIQNE